MEEDKNKQLKKDLNVKIGAAIREAREAAGLTQNKLAELISVGPKTISKMELGVIGISTETLIRICEVLTVSSDTLLFGKKSTNDIDYFNERLRQLPQEKLNITLEIMNKLFEAFTLK